jgi:hypothetical protein
MNPNATSLPTLGAWVFANGNQVIGTFTQTEDREGEEEGEEGAEEKPPQNVTLKWSSQKNVQVHV